jgi:molecular chaperone GrpE
LVQGRDDPAEDPPQDEPRPDDRPIELQDPSLAEPPPPAPEARDGFDPVDSEAEEPAPESAPAASPAPEPGAAHPAFTPPPAAAQEEVESSLNYRAFEQRARLAEDRLAEVLDGYRKLKTETEEHKIRIGRNLERRFEQRHEKLLLKFIEILDNLDRGLDAAEKTFAGEALIQGLILVRTQLLQTLKEEGLERIPVLGLPYDPHVSEGMSHEPVTDKEKDGIVLREMLRGYRLNGRVVRASQVVIGSFVASGETEPLEITAPDSAETLPSGNNGVDASDSAATTDNNDNE